jgi:uncharacterized protein YkwD
MEPWQIGACVAAAVVVIVLAVVLPMVLVHRPVMAVPMTGRLQTPTVAPPLSAVTSLVASLRAAHGAAPLVYDPTIAAVSLAWANHLLQNGGALVHSQNPAYGENLASFRGYPDGTVDLMNMAIRAWYNEGSVYDYDNPGFSAQTGHFTCLVWRSSTRYGIAVAYDPKTTTAIVVMNTAPPGNVDTPASFRANVLPPR